MSCIYCGKQILNKGSLKSHEIRCKLNPDRVVLAPFKGKVPWNKGLTKDTSPIIAEQARKVSQTTTGRKGSQKRKSLAGVRKGGITVFGVTVAGN